MHWPIRVVAFKSADGVHCMADLIDLEEAFVCRCAAYCHHAGI